jgi:hypothetical protein
MYCPSCGAENEDSQHYCARCGANISTVSDILRGRFPVPVEVDERLVGLLKDVYRGRRSALIGGIVSVVSLGKLAPILLFGLASFSTIGILLLPFVVAGLIFLIWGLTKWNNAAAEIKAIKQVAAASIPRAAETRQIAEPPADLDTQGSLSTQAKVPIEKHLERG